MQNKFNSYEMNLDLLFNLLVLIVMILCILTSNSVIASSVFIAIYSFNVSLLFKEFSLTMTSVKNLGLLIGDKVKSYFKY